MDRYDQSIGLSSQDYKMADKSNFIINENMYNCNAIVIIYLLYNRGCSKTSVLEQQP
jgi:hypothetical protein